MKGKKRDMPSFTKQDRPPKVKEIYRALKREHPEMSAEMKARIAARQGKPGKQKQGPPYKGPLTKQSAAWGYFRKSASAISEADMRKVRGHGKVYGRRHAELMLQYMVIGKSVDEAHVLALRKSRLTKRAEVLEATTDTIPDPSDHDGATEETGVNMSLPDTVSDSAAQKENTKGSVGVGRLFGGGKRAKYKGFRKRNTRVQYAV